MRATPVASKDYDSQSEGETSIGTSLKEDRLYTQVQPVSLKLHSGMFTFSAIHCHRWLECSTHHHPCVLLCCNFQLSH